MMPSPLRNGNDNNNNHHQQHHRRWMFMSTVSEHKMRRLNYLLLLFRLASFSFSVASAVFNMSDSSSSSNSSSISSLNFLSFRFLFAANAIVTVYSLFQMASATWEILKGSTLLPLSAQLWLDFSHDQVFAYMVLAAAVAGAAEAVRLTQGPTCQEDGHQSFCIQANISVALAFAGFLFLALATLATGFRLVCFLTTGSRFPM